MIDTQALEHSIKYPVECFVCRGDLADDTHVCECKEPVKVDLDRLLERNKNESFQI